MLTPTRQYRKKGGISAAVFCNIITLRAAPTAPPSPSSPVPSRQITRKNEIKQSQSPPFFFGTEKGGLVYADDLGHCTDVQQLSSGIDIMLFFEERARLVILTRSLLLTQYQVAEDGKVSRVMQVKLSVAGDLSSTGLHSVVWAGAGVLAIATQERMLRLLDISGDESYNLSLSMVSDVVDRNDCVYAVAFNPIDRYLAIGTAMGGVIIWKFIGQSRDMLSIANGTAKSTSAEDWMLHFKTALNSPIREISWQKGQSLLLVTTDDELVVFSESFIHTCMVGNLTIMQDAYSSVVVQASELDPWRENTEILIKGISSSRSSFVLWSGKEVKVYKVDMQLGRSEEFPAFTSTSLSVVIADANDISDEALFLTEGNTVLILNFAGVQKGVIHFSEAEGIPTILDVNGRYLAVMTNKSYVKVYDVYTPTKPKQQGSSGVFFENGTDHTTKSIRKIKVNAQGSKIAVLCDYIEGSLKVRHPDSKLYVFDRNKGGVYFYDFAQVDRFPSTVFWDEIDERLLVCEAQISRKASANPAANPSKSTDAVDIPKPSSTDASDEELEVEVVLFFATSDYGLKLQDSFPRIAPNGSLIYLSVPKIFFRGTNSLVIDDNAEEEKKTEDNFLRIYYKVMRDFVGLDDVEDSVRATLLDFSFYLTLGKLDEAYRAVRLIDSPSIWENMAQMCVKTKRLDVAEVCLGHMGHARGAAALRESMAESTSIEASVGVLAVHLGLLDDAARLFREAKRFDLLNQLYQSAGMWEKSIKVASSSDRIHLKTTYFAYAKYLESIGDVEGAMENYENSDTFRTEIPRMLYALGREVELEDYVQHSNDATLLKWWGGYLESKELFDKAKKYYTRAKDSLSLVRIACFKGDLNAAAAIVQDSGDKSSAYHFARQLEAQGELREAITYYAMAECFNHAIRLAKSFNLDSEVMKYSIMASPAVTLECASHFESKGEYDKAVQLYHKGGDLSRALNLCFRAGSETSSQSAAMYDMVNTIASDLGASSSPQILARCAEFLVQNKQFPKAVELYVMAKRYSMAIDMCLQHKVLISEEMAENLTPPEDAMEATDRREALKNLGKALKDQGSFILAYKKYTQANDRVRGMKCLILSGDTKAVIQYAKRAGSSEIYKLAANYLQQLNWRESADIMKSIINFYDKAKAYEQLAGFYDSCAQVSIDCYFTFLSIILSYNYLYFRWRLTSTETTTRLLEPLKKH